MAKERLFQLVAGPDAAIPRPITMNGSPLPSKTFQKYVGIHFQTNTANIFAKHYTEKATEAAAAASRVLHVESMIAGRLPPEVAKQLYMARIDPLLTQGCEVMPDVDSNRLLKLERVQRGFIRRCLGARDGSVSAPLYTETGFIPLKYR